MSDVFYRVCVAMLVLILFGVSGYYRRKANQRRGPVQAGRAEARFHVFLRMAAFVGLMTMVGLNIVAPGTVTWARMELPQIARGAGLLIVVACVPLFIWMFRSLGTNISSSAQVRAQHELVTSGPYRWIRHPLYSFSVLCWTGIALALQNWVVLALFWGAFAVIHVRTASEEAALIARFGDAYRNYMDRTGRYWPKRL